MGTLSWCASIGLFISYTQTHVMEVLVASGLFAIAGAICTLGVSIKK